MSTIDIHESTARVSDILEQISKLNEMVEFHKNESKELSMQKQYEEMRNNFLLELNGILQQFNIKIEGLAA